MKIHSVQIMDKGKKFIRKYFLDGQKLEAGQVAALASLPDDAPLLDRVMVKHRRLIGILIPLLFFEACWWCQAIKHDYFAYFPDRYLLSITMVFGSLVAGMTSEGGGAVAFPVMSLALGIKPSVARDFSLMIQSCGMTAAAFTIFWMKVKLEWHSLVFCSLGAVAGMVTGLEVVDKALSPPEKKLGFVCIWFSFAFALFLLNREHKEDVRHDPKLRVVADCGPPGGGLPGGHLQLCRRQWSRHLLLLRPLTPLQGQRKGVHPHFHCPDGCQHLCRLLLATDDD